MAKMKRLAELTKRIDKTLQKAKDAKPTNAKPTNAKPTKDDSAVTSGRRARVGKPTNIPKTGGNEQEVYQRNMSPAAVRAIDRNQRTGGPELTAGAGPSTPGAYRSMQGARARGVVGGLEDRIDRLKKLQAKVNDGTATDAEKVAAKTMPNAIKDDMKRFGVTSDDYKSPTMEKQAEKIIKAFQDLKDSGLAKGGMPKKKKGYMGGGMAENKKSYMGGGMANGKMHSYVAGGYVNDMMGKKKK